MTAPSTQLGLEPENDPIALATEQVLGRWARRYLAVVVGVALFGGVLVLAPSTVPDTAPFDFDFAGLDEASVPPGRAASQEGSSVALPPTSPPTRSAPPSATSGPGAGANAGNEPPGAGASPPPRPISPVDPSPPGEPTPQPGDCPLPLPDAGTATLPTGAVLRLASPVLPVIGPFVPAALAALPILEPVLPAALPLVPAAEGLLVQLGDLSAPVLGPIVEIEGRLVQPAQPLLEPLGDAALTGTQFLVTSLQPVLDLAKQIPVFDCVGRVEAELIRRAQQPSGTESAGAAVSTASIQWSSGMSDELWRTIVDRSQDPDTGVIVRLVASAGSMADRYSPERFAEWVAEVVWSLPQVSGFEIIAADPADASSGAVALRGGAAALLPAVERALAARRVGQLVGVGVTSDQMEPLRRALGRLPERLRSRINFVDVLLATGSEPSDLERHADGVDRLLGTIDPDGNRTARAVSVPAAGEIDRWRDATAPYQLVQFDMRAVEADSHASLAAAIDRFAAGRP